MESELDSDKLHMLQGRAFELRVINSLPLQIEERLANLTRKAKEKEEDARSRIHAGREG